MPLQTAYVGTHPSQESKKSFLLLRWLLIILASYLTIFSRLSESPGPVFLVVIAFWLSNLAVMLIPAQRLLEDRFTQFITLIDLALVSCCFYLLRVPGNYVWAGALLIFAVASLFRNLQVLFFSIMLVGVLYLLFTRVQVFGPEIAIHGERFLTLASFFVVSVFYLFLAERLRTEALISRTLLAEKRNAEVLAEISRTLSTTLKTEEILYGIVTRLRNVMEAQECLILSAAPGGHTARLVVKAGEPGLRDVEVLVDDFPDLIGAYQARKPLFSPRGTEKHLALPMVLQDSVVGVIYFRWYRDLYQLTETNIQFCEVVAATAANALRNAQLFEEVEYRARTDFLTGLPNHRSFQVTLSAELGRAARHNHPTSLLIIDLDNLKAINDRFGHPRGDFVLRRVAERMRATCREFDFAARYGGDEFTVVLPETGLVAAVQVAERFREIVAAEEFEGIGYLTVSIGVACCPTNAANKDDLIRAADQALYHAKDTGRNRVGSFNFHLAAG